MDFIAELKWRGMLHDAMPGLEEQLAKEPTTGYVGFDPTADSLHIGNLVPVMLLVHLQQYRTDIQGPWDVAVRAFLDKKPERKAASQT